MRLLCVITLLVISHAQAAPVELLHHVPAQIAVSSQVESKTIAPHHLVDGDRKTAWNSAARQLVGGWIEFRVPTAVTVHEIKLIVGHTGRGKDGDYFPLNHRIKRLRILHDTVKVADVTLDPESRELQSIKIDRPGGVYRLQVLETVPGKKKSWRELAVAELEVWGTLPSGMQPRRHEYGVGSVKVGKLAAPEVKFDRAAANIHATFAEVCRYGCDPANTKYPRLVVKNPKRIKQVVVETGDAPRIFMETDKGWWVAGSMAAGAYLDKTYLPAVEMFEVIDDVLMMQFDWKAPSGPNHTRLFTMCGVEASGRPSCLRTGMMFGGVPLEVVHEGFKVRHHHVVTMANGWLGIDRGKNGDAWEDLIGDHRIDF